MSGILQRLPDLSGAAIACGQWLTAALLRDLATAETVTLAISGGGSPKPMFRYLVDAPIPWDRVHLFWVDERAVPPTDPQSNFKLADELLIRPGKLLSANIHRILAELPPEEAAARYAEDIRQHFGLKAGEIPEFTAIHLGMGPDGHTASLFPGTPLIHDRAGIAAAVWVEKLKTHRITLLPAVLLRAKNTAFLASGDDKASMLDNVLNGDFNPQQYPSQLFAREGRNVTWFLDDAAAKMV